MSFCVEPVHRNRKLLEDCARVLNEEWPRSFTARVISLEKSCDDLPCCLAFVREDETSNKSVIGHCRFSKVAGLPKACFVESVVIKKSLRGQGLGRKLMELSERHAVSLGITCIYLTTHDKEKFYQHVGYDYCEPVLALGGASNLISSKLSQAFLQNMTTTRHAGKSMQSVEDNNLKEKNGQILEQPHVPCQDVPSLPTQVTSQFPKVPAPPPHAPPPAPPQCVPAPPPSVPAPPPLAPAPPPPSTRNASTQCNKQYWMKKQLIS